MIVYLLNNSESYSSTPGTVHHSGYTQFSSVSLTSKEAATMQLQRSPPEKQKMTTYTSLKS